MSNMRKEAAVKAKTIAPTEMISNGGPKINPGCKVTNSLSENLEEVKFDKKDNIDAEEVNNATVFVKMKTMNQSLFLFLSPPGTVRTAANATVATSVATSIPDLAVTLAAPFISSDNCLCSS